MEPIEREEPLLRTSGHDVDPARDESFAVESPEGNVVRFEALRLSDDPDFMTANMTTTGAGNEYTDSRYVRLGRRVASAKEHTVEFLEPRKGKIAIIGTAVLVIAASAGIAVRRFKQK